MTKTTWLLSVLLATTVLACVALTYLWIDRSISLSYSQASTESATRTVRNLERVLAEEWRGIPEDQVIQKLQKIVTQNPEANIILKKVDGFVWLDEVRFNFKKGHLLEIGETQ